MKPYIYSVNFQCQIQNYIRHDYYLRHILYRVCQISSVIIDNEYFVFCWILDFYSIYYHLYPTSCSYFFLYRFRFLIVCEMYLATKFSWSPSRIKKIIYKTRISIGVYLHDFSQFSSNSNIYHSCEV